jgi:DNA recombination protein RmuC
MAAGIAWGIYAVRQAFQRGRREAELESAPLKEKASNLESRLRETESRLEESRTALNKVEREQSAVEAVLRETREREPEMRRTLQQELSTLAAKFLDEKGKEFSEKNLKSLDDVLNPLRERIKDFEKKVETVYDKEAEQRISLKKEIEILNLANQRISQDAQNLATALKGQNKTGGNWGEIILERVLESSGLEKGREYSIQQTLEGDDGKFRPDVIINLPEKRHLVVDSKLSLVAYERFCFAENPETAEVEMKAHTQSIRRHVDGLSAKKYQDLYGLQTVDFVFLFMPVEPAFTEAVKKDPALFQDSFEKSVIIVSPSTLMFTLRTVASIWKQEYRSRNAAEIARQAGLLHEKFVGFLGDLEDVGDNLTKAQSRFEEARKKLKDGRGNLIGKVDELKKLGAKSSKSIPESWKDSMDETTDSSATGLPDHPG